MTLITIFIILILSTIFYLIVIKNASNCLEGEMNKKNCDIRRSWNIFLEHASQEKTNLFFPSNFQKSFFLSSLFFSCHLRFFFRRLSFFLNDCMHLLMDVIVWLECFVYSHNYILLCINIFVDRNRLGKTRDLRIRRLSGFYIIYASHRREDTLSNFSTPT